MAYGTCLEPTVAQCNLSLNSINRPSVDPSRPLPFWDKSRLKFHGHLTAYCKHVHWLYHASLLNPYNTTEMLDWAWSDMLLDWTSCKLEIKLYLCEFYDLGTELAHTSLDHKVLYTVLF